VGSAWAIEIVEAFPHGQFLLESVGLPHLLVAQSGKISGTAVALAIANPMADPTLQSHA
jgi:hypothetical protein